MNVHRLIDRHPGVALTAAALTVGAVTGVAVALDAATSPWDQHFPSSSGVIVHKLAPSKWDSSTARVSIINTAQGATVSLMPVGDSTQIPLDSLDTSTATGGCAVTTPRRTGSGVTFGLKAHAPKAPADATNFDVVSLSFAALEGTDPDGKARMFGYRITVDAKCNATLGEMTSKPTEVSQYQPVAAGERPATLPGAFLG